MLVAVCVVGGSASCVHRFTKVPKPRHRVLNMIFVEYDILTAARPALPRAKSRETYISMRQHPLPPPALSPALPPALPPTLPPARRRSGKQRQAAAGMPPRPAAAVLALALAAAALLPRQVLAVDTDGTLCRVTLNTISVGFRTFQCTKQAVFSGVGNPNLGISTEVCPLITRQEEGWRRCTTETQGKPHGQITIR